MAYDDLIPRIIIDDRERAIADRLRESKLFEIEEERLEIGDLVINDLVIERKSADDFVRSLKEGRLFRQLLFMKRMYRKRLLLIEGLSRRNSSPAIQGAITRIAAALQIPILQSVNILDSCKLIERIALHQFGFTVSRLSSQKDPKLAEFHQVYVLSGIPGVGLTRAKNLLRHFGSLRAVFSASMEEFQKVEGIGEQIAQDITNVINASNIQTTIK